MESASPPPIEFTSTAGELERVYASLVPGSRTRLAWISGIQAFAWSGLAVVNFNAGGRSRFVAWFAVVLAIFYVADVLLKLRAMANQRRALASSTSLRVTFSESTIDVSGDARGVRSIRTIELQMVRSVRIVADALVVLTSAGSSRPALIVPLRALPDGGDAAMRWFDDRIVAKRMLRRGSDSRTTLVNTALR